MDHDDIITAIASLETVAKRFDAIADKLATHEPRIASLEASRSKVVGWAAGIVGSLLVGVALYFLVGKGHP